MNWIFGAFLAVSLIHMGEEYIYPGGFPEFMKRMNPRFASHVTTGFAVIMNGLQLLLCILAWVVKENNLVFSLSVAGLLFVNGWMHLIGSIRAKTYAPGLVTGIVLYLPLSVYAYSLFWNSGQLTVLEALTTVILGALYQLLPISYLFLPSALFKRA